MLYQSIAFMGCDRSSEGLLRPAAFLRRMQEAALLDLDGSGLADQTLRAHSLAFVLSKISLRVYDASPKPDALSLQTFARETLGASFLRDFRFFAEDRKTLFAAATTRWGLLNLETRTLCRPDTLPVSVASFPDDALDFSCPRLSSKVPEEARFLGEVRVPLYMTDANAHLNNASYLDLCLEQTGDIALEALDIEYLHEAKTGDVLSFYRSEGAGEFTLYAVREETPVFLARYQTSSKNA